MTRNEVYKLIDGEREYQERRWERPKHNHSATEYLVYVDHYVKTAFQRVSTQDGENGALECLRKIAALAVAAMEEHGAPPRTPVAEPQAERGHGSGPTFTHGAGPQEPSCR